MTELLQPNGDFDINNPHDRSHDSNDQLPTPLLTPLIGSPLLQTLAVGRDEPVFDSLSEKLKTPTSAQNATASAKEPLPPLSTPVATVNGHKEIATSHRTNDGGERRRAASDRLATPGMVTGGSERLDKVLKLSPQELKELTLDAGSLPVRVATPTLSEEEMPFSAPPYPVKMMSEARSDDQRVWEKWEVEEGSRGRPTAYRTRRHGSFMTGKGKVGEEIKGDASAKGEDRSFDVLQSRPVMPARTASTPPNIRRKASSRGHSSKDTTSHKKFERIALPPLEVPEDKEEVARPSMNGHAKALASTPTPMTASILPIPPLSIPTFLQLELDAEEPSQLYIHRPASTDIPYESSAVKFERLENFLLLPGHLEGTLLFGAAACFDAWLYNLTILPLRFLRALAILGEWWLRNAWKEICDLVDFVYRGIGRLWRRKRSGSAPPGSGTPATQPPSRRQSIASDLPPLQLPSARKDHALPAWSEQPKRIHKSSVRRHRRTRSTPSLLLPNHKADLLKGFLIICSSFLLMYLDPSRMYHNIRGQAAIKLYVIYNMLEVADKLLGSIGQDILECLFSRETLERKPDGRSKVLRPVSLFLLSLIYNVIHASALFYQVITLNVAVNSYSNALLTLLMSNQFVEIKGAVFKKFEKENLFQMCCADVVERFQLLLMLLIIAMRNIVEVGGLSISFTSPSNGFAASPTADTPPSANATGTPFSSSSILPQSFNILPSTILSGQVLTPFLIVIASEMLVDWLKYAYINKFNNFRPAIFGRFFDVLARDYYTHAFSGEGGANLGLTRRIGLPVFPLTCLFVRACVQTWGMLVGSWGPSVKPLVMSSVTSLAIEEDLPTSTPATVAALAHIDRLFRKALNFESTAADSGGSGLPSWISYVWREWTRLDDFTAAFTTVSLVLIVYLLLLAFKLVWGMFLLALARRRYMGMQMREQERERADRERNERASRTADVLVEGKRAGGWGQVEVGDERRKVIYEDDREGLVRVREKERKVEETKRRGEEVDYGRVRRYDMVAKRIW